MLKEVRQPAWSLSEFDKTLVAATYFGFMPIAAPRITEVDLEVTRHCALHPHYDAAERAALIRTYLDHNFASLPHPLAVVYKKSVVKKRLGGYSLHFIGATSGIAEATLIRAALSMLSEEGYKNLRVDVNCIGDKESISLYERELVNFARKYGADLPEHLRLSIREDVWNLFRMEEEEAVALRSMAPSSVSFLSAQSRIHFKEVLEYLEALGVDFRLTPNLVGEKNHCSHTIFAIKNFSEEEENVLAVGYRYSRLAKKLGLRKEIPMASVTLFSQVGVLPDKKIYKQLPRPKFYLVQLGQAAKIKTLSLIELLREHHIPVHHFLGKDKLTVQLSNAENLRVAYLIIIGQKEALEGTATVRNVATRAQDTIPLEMLPQYLKNISL
ncbi:MAG: His/Gly/Thr/Pro-type tRNA ligase C-terminal domain-containing protein [bacterium]|nr:His/Gly/Thr/Pro-type tRNA ligase C-terminal domain-containing protein [bacterium]